METDLSKQLTRFLNHHFAPTIMSKVHHIENELITLELSFDLQLMQKYKFIYLFFEEFPRSPNLVSTLLTIIRVSLNCFPLVFTTSSGMLIIPQKQQTTYRQFQVHLNQLNPKPSFTTVPKFETPLHDLNFQSYIQNKGVGTLVHLKQVTIFKVFQRQEYLRLQYFQCSCKDELYIQLNDLATLIKHNHLNLKNGSCRKKCGCGNYLTEIPQKRRFEACQRLLVHVHDLDPLNRRKYQNLQSKEKKQVSLKYKLLVDENVDYALEGKRDESVIYRVCNNRFNLKDQLYVLYLGGELVNNFKAGKEIYSLAYYDYYISKQWCQNSKMFVESEPYFVAVTADQLRNVPNKDYFKNYLCSFSLENPSQGGMYPIQQHEIFQLLSGLAELIIKQNKHFTHGKENTRLAFDIYETLEVICNNSCPSSLPQGSLFPLKIACLLSIMLQNSANFAYYLNRESESKANILVKHFAYEENVNERALNLCFIVEDKELIVDAIEEMIDRLDDAYYLPSEIDEATLDLLLMNLVRGGILIVKNYLSQKDAVKKKLKQALKGNDITIKYQDEYLTVRLDCSIWVLVDLAELQPKKKEETIEIKYLSSNDKMIELKNLFDIVLDLSYANNQLRAIKNEFYFEQMDMVFAEVTKQDLDRTHLQPVFHLKNMLLTSATPRRGAVDQESAPCQSSCYFLSQNNHDQKTLLTLLTSLDTTKKLQLFTEADQQCESILQKYFMEMRKQPIQTSRLMSTCAKIATASSLIRYFTYQSINDFNGIYSLLLFKAYNLNEKIPWHFADIFLTILLTLETRLNVIGPEGGVIATEPANFLYNSSNNNQRPVELSLLSGTEEEIKFMKFKQLYDRILQLFS